MDKFKVFTHTGNDKELESWLNGLSEHGKYAMKIDRTVPIDKGTLIIVNRWSPSLHPLFKSGPGPIQLMESQPEEFKEPEIQTEEVA